MRTPTVAPEQRSCYDRRVVRLDEPGLARAARALGTRLRPGDVVLLEGPMGAGKTTFTRALAEGLGLDHPQRVRSPTYTLCSVHPGPRPLAHVDLFRLAVEDDPGPGSVSAAAFEALGLDDMADAAGVGEVVLVVEWADLWADPPPAHVRIRLEPSPDHAHERQLRADPQGDRPRALVTAWMDEIGVS